MFRLRYVCAIAAFAVTTGASGARITFERTVPARQSLGDAEDLVITYAVGDTDRITTFIDVFLDQATRGGMLRVIDPTMVERSTERHHRWRRPPKYVDQRYRADAYLRIDRFSCETMERSGQGGAYDVDGNRVRRTQRWVDATCTAHLEALAKESKKKIVEFSVRGEGTSSRVDTLTDEEREIATDQAARYAAVAAAEEITPRRVRETITLIEDSPAFERGMAMIESEQNDLARQIWERTAKSNPESAALQFNLAAVCEASGDLKAAGEHYDAARRLAPGDPRFRFERDMFLRRYGLKP